MAKDKKTPKKDSKKKGKKASKPEQPKAAAAPAAPEGVDASKVKEAVRKVGKQASAIATNPLVAEVVAATLVAAAAAIRNPAKARQLAAEAGDEMRDLQGKAADRGNAVWQLALDAARHALDSLEGVTPEAADGKAKKRK